jgi:hypothetical protein
MPGQSAVAGSPPRPILGVPETFNRNLVVPDLHNLPPTPDYTTVCAWKGRNNRNCIRLAVQAIEHARSAEHMKKYNLILPNNFRKLTVARQTFVITDLERVDRGVRPYAGLISPLNHASHVAATAGVDPTPAFAMLRVLGVGEWGSIWANDYGPLAADYDWMYNDGYSANGSINIACPTPGAPGCWGHRQNILYPDKGMPYLTAGAGTAKPAGASIAAILSGGYLKPDAYDYTWHRALMHGANGHRIAARFRRR